MVSILLVAHAPLASSLQAVACHTYDECSRQVGAVDVPAGATLEEAEAQISAALKRLPAGPDVLILADVFGATPCNAALNVADGVHIRVVTGANVPTLWRTLCYSQLPLADLVARAVDGGRQGIMQVATPCRQNQPQPEPQRPSLNDPDHNPDQ